ncbi:hypothetical protein F4782DRAFT_549001 [Xylaria castorea]|nr:hypothetical protein F4782DRAFT_549001 [Xylaria castorea]
MVKDAAAHSDLLPRKRRTSLSGFFSKILLSNRPEQGGTTRIQDMTGETDSAYEDLGMNPNELTEWNLAQERSPGPQHHRGQSWSMQRRRTRLRDDIGESPQVSQRTPSFDLARSPKPPEPLDLKPPHHVQHKRLQPLAREGIHDTLRAKEDIRKHRRGLKESGDWLGVQGADPYSGEFAVLTPTSTLSSEITPPHTRKRLAELSRRQRFAKIAYDQAKCREETEREKAHLRKAESKLEKIEGAKEELRQQQEFPTWIQHKRRWSSAAEPDLSPIPQSLRSYGIETNSDEVAAVPIRNFSHPSKSSGGSDAIDQSKPADMFNNSENTEPSKHDHRRSPSTDTIVHKSLTNMEFPDTSIRTTNMLYPSVFLDTDDSSTQEQTTKKPFLWRRRRRMTGPGKLVQRSSSLMTHSSAGKTEESPVSDLSAESPPPVPRLQTKDHFSDLLIPESQLHLVPCRERMAITGISPDPMKREPSPIIARRPTHGSHSEARNESALKVATNLFDCRKPKIRPPRNVLDANGAIAISYQLRLKRNTRPTSSYQRIIPLRSSSAQGRIVQPQASQIQNHDTGQTQNHVDMDLLGHTPGIQNLRQPTTQEDSRTTLLTDYTSSHVKEIHERDPGGFASTPTTIITGFDPDLQPPLEETQSHMEPRKNMEGITIGSNESSATPSPQSCEQKLYNASATNEEWETTTSSHPTTPQKNLQSFVLAHKTPETDIASTGLAKLEIGPTPGAWHHEIDQDQNIQSKASRINEASVPYHLRANGVRLVHQRRELYEDREAMIQEAARIAIQRSRAKEIITTRSRTPSRTPGPLTQGAREATSAIPSPKRNGGGGVVKPDIHIIDVGFLIEQDAKRRHPRDIAAILGDKARGGNTKPGSAVVFVSFVVAVGMIALGLACAAWSVAKPAFDTRSQLWRRRRRGENTCEDHGVFVTAGAFLVVAALIIAGMVRAVPWIVSHL